VRILVTGWDGLVGRELRAALAGGAGVVVGGGDLPGLDVRFRGLLLHRARRFRPDWIVNLAAWTEVDACESDPRAALLSNAEGAGNAAAAARACGARLLQVSTDYVFPGDDPSPRSERDPVGPLSAYGRSKAAGESAAAALLPPGRWLVVRGQSLYGNGRKSFPDAILRAAAAKPEVPVVTDQVVSPTWARDFARILALLLRRGARGTFHASASGSCTWNEFARAVLEDSGGDPARITPATAASLLRPAPRPASSVFDLGKLARAAGLRPRPWREQLRDYLASTGRRAA
jgi:dTDP-4-dehydrorhamnose reductase